jgi:hypothetical protein
MAFGKRDDHHAVITAAGDLHAKGSVVVVTEPSPTGVPADGSGSRAPAGAT